MELDPGKMLNHMRKLMEVVTQTNTCGRSQLDVLLEESKLNSENGHGKFLWAKKVPVRLFVFLKNAKLSLARIALVCAFKNT